MENGITAKAALDIIDELINDIEDFRASQLACSMPDLNPFKDVKPFQNVKFVPPEVEMRRIPDDLHDPSYQPVIVDFKAVMQNQQKTIAIEHAKKVREGKESVNMNAILREKYGEDSYYFPDRILNSGLSKKDFTAPFLIDVKLINQDLGMTAELGENEESPPPVQRSVHGNGFRVNLRDEKRKHDKISGLESGVKNSPTLYAMLEKQEPGPKRVKIVEPIKYGSPLTRQAIAARQAQAEGRAEGSILARTLAPTVSGSKAVPGARLQQVGSSSPPVLIRNGVQQVIPKPVAQVQGKSPVPIKPKPEPPQLKPMHSIPLGALSNAADKLARNPQVTITPVPAEPPSQDDDFSPKIVNTQGNVKLASSTPEKRLSNGVTPTPPKLKKIVETSSSSSSAATTKTGVRGSGFLGCKMCGKTFPSNCDNLFRSHMIIKHNKEITDKCILEAKIQVSQWYKCKKCSLMVLNNLEEHNRRCCPDIDYDSAFDAIQVVTDNVPKLQCGLCQDTVESRVHLSLHLEDKHSDIANKVLLDPHFRCGTCLLIFSDSAKLISHVAECRNTTPSLDTAQELAQKNLYCEICAKKHSKIRETLFCYQVKTLLRCVLCLHVSIDRNNFFNHLKVYHDRRTGICCPFCNDNEEKPTRAAFDHFIDSHYNIALKRAGEQALVRGRIQLQAQSAAQKLAAGSNGLGGGPRTASPKVMPALKPKTVLVTQQNVSGGNMIPQAIRVPVSQFLRIGNPGGINTTTTVLGNAAGLPPGTTTLLRPVVVPQRGVLPQMPLGFTLVPTSNIQTTIAPSTGTTLTQIEPVDSIGEDSILGM